MSQDLLILRLRVTHCAIKRLEAGLRARQAAAQAAGEPGLTVTAEIAALMSQLDDLGREFIALRAQANEELLRIAMEDEDA